jgi:hypothetical protein
MTSEELEVGLANRGFTGIEGMDNMGECNLNEKHYVLRTDGLIIYSDIPFWTDTKYYPGSRCESWPQEQDEDGLDPNPVFTWEEFDKIIYENKNTTPKLG